MLRQRLYCSLDLWENLYQVALRKMGAALILLLICGVTVCLFNPPLPFSLSHHPLHHPFPALAPSSPPYPFFHPPIPLFTSPSPPDPLCYIPYLTFFLLTTLPPSLPSLFHHPVSFFPAPSPSSPPHPSSAPTKTINPSAVTMGVTVPVMSVWNSAKNVCSEIFCKGCWVGAL